MAFLSDQSVLNLQIVPAKKVNNKLSKCALCNQFKINVHSIAKVTGNIRVGKTLVPRKNILLKTIRAQKKLSSNQVAKLAPTNKKFALKFCSTFTQKYASRKLLKKCQNNQCQQIKPEFEPDIKLSIYNARKSI